jgi:phosphatidylserine/phosphatidylglycerophosphate/cardiolipin synthase-like enzyme/uncharacterized membrane protein YdjX (TVP38/TMEM64 family)
VLLDGGPYFAAAWDALRQAQRSILILAWDVDSRLLLRRGSYAPPRPDEEGLPDTLADLLTALVTRRPELEVHLLVWDPAIFYQFERELLPTWRLGWTTPTRLRFRLDSSHAPGCSQHEKIVVVDDAVAFTGGLDLGRCRWDTPEHRPDDELRRDPNGTPFAPFHDVQVVVEGPVAAALGERARERWARTGGTPPEPPGPRTGPTPWPADVGPDLEDVPVAVARTEWRYGGAIREIERLYLDAIHAAERSIYLENQFLTAESVTRALVARLRERDGPAVVLVLPAKASGWVEESTIGLLAARALLRLRAADRHARLGLYRPVAGPGAEGRPTPVYVHSKVAVFDDRLLVVGSANLTNRSLTIDSECALAVEAPPGDERLRAAVGGIQDRLVAHHLGVAPEVVGEALRAAGGDLHAAVEALRRPDDCRTLVPLEPSLPEERRGLVPDLQLVDPSAPLDARTIVGHFVPEAQRPSARRRLAKLVGVFALVGALVAAWRFTGLRELVDVGAVAGWLDDVSGAPWALPLMLAVFVVAGSLGFPITVLIAATAIAFPPLPGFALAFTGAMGAAAASYGLGALLGGDAVRRLLGRRADRFAAWLGRRGLLTMIAVRVLPVAPFAFINVAAGATHVRFRDYALGTVIGMTPGIFGLAFFVDRLWDAVRRPSLLTLGIAAAVLAGLVAAGLLFRRWLVRRQASPRGGAPRPTAPDSGAASSVGSDGSGCRVDPGGSPPETSE